MNGFTHNTTHRLSANAFEASRSKVDSEYFGISTAIAVFHDDRISDQEFGHLRQYFLDFDFVMITNKGDRPSINRWLGEKTSAFLTDVNVQLSKKISSSDDQHGVEIEIREEFPGDTQIIDLADNAFPYSRFLKDPYLPAQKAKHIYGDIVENAFRQEGRFFAIARNSEETSGFLLFNFNEEGTTAKIELIAIDEKYRGQGIGRSLLQCLQQFAGYRGAGQINVGTQLSNLNALRFYFAHDYLVSSVNSIYHFWPNIQN